MYKRQGKDEIIAALFEDFDVEIRQVLSAPLNDPLAIEDNWIYLYIIFEEIFDFRFFYRNQGELLQRIPELRGPFSRILALKERAVFSILSTLEDMKKLTFDEGEKGALAGRLAQHFTFWLQYHDLRYGTAPQKNLIDQGVFMTLIQITPYWRGGEGYVELLSEFASDKMD